jgi:hypothetical protein
MRLSTSLLSCFALVSLAVLFATCEDDDTRPSPPPHDGGGTDQATTPDRAPDIPPDVTPDVTPDTTVGDASGAMGFFPCDVQAVLAAKCHTCHIASAPRPEGAPFSLMTYADTQAPFPGDATKKVYQVMKTAVETDFMPLSISPTGPLVGGQKATLLAWLNAGAPPAASPCTTALDGGSAG